VDLEESITLHRQSLDLISPGDARRSKELNDLAASPSVRFDQIDKMIDLDEAIGLYSVALELGHLDRPRPLSMFRLALHNAYKQNGDMRMLEKSITYHRESLDVCAIGHPQRGKCLINLAIDTGFHHTGHVQDLEQAIIVCHRQSLDLRAPGHPDRVFSLSKLGVSRTRFQHMSRIEDLEEAITYHRESVSIRPRGHTNRLNSLNNLAAAIELRFNHTSDLDGVDEVMLFLWKFCHPSIHIVLTYSTTSHSLSIVDSSKLICQRI
jgi:hypothetical protein